MKRPFIAIISFLLVAGVYAQNEVDALRYSRLNPTGTARATAMGGAFGALGADFTTLSNNPAGIGVYKSSEFTFTPSLFVGRSESKYFGEVNEDERYNMNFGNVGIILVSDLTLRNPESQFKNVQFGFGMNRLANFNNRVIIDGFNESSSYLTPYVNASQGLSLNDLDDFGSGMAYDTELMYTNAQGQYVIDMPNGGVSQRKSIDTRGSINEMVFSLGTNINDQIYLGATIGIPSIRYRETSIYTEADTEQRNDYFKSFTRTDELETTGTGVNFKAGIIVRASDWLRVGGAIETPTFYTMSDSYSTSFRSYFDTVSSLSTSASGFYEYQLTTPFKAMAGVGFIIGKQGLISMDYQYLDYANARLRASDYDFEIENDAIRDGYLTAHNIRLGAEWRLGALSLRGGYGLSANPYRYGTNSVMNTLSAGLGLRGQKFFADFAWAMNGMDDEYYLYNAPATADPAVANTRINNTTLLMTIGFRY